MVNFRAVALGACASAVPGTFMQLRSMLPDLPLDAAVRLCLPAAVAALAAILALLCSPASKDTQSPTPSPPSSNSAAAATSASSAAVSATRGWPTVKAEQVQELIRKRRSMFPKDYNGEEVPDDAIWQILEAANWAPTHGKTEPWRFVVLKSGRARTEFIKANNAARIAAADTAEAREKLRSKFERKAPIIQKCSHLVLIVRKRVTTSKGKLMPEWEETASVAMAVENMHLMATALSVAAYWSSSGWNTSLADPSVKALLGLDAEDACLGIFHVGRIDRAEKYRASRGPIREKVAWPAADTALPVQWPGSGESKAQ